MEAVARIEKEDEVAGGQVERLVHGVIEPAVGFAQAGHFVAHGGHAVAFLVAVDECERLVL